MKYAINPPNTPLVDDRGFVRPEWYRYFVQNKAQGDGITESTVVTVDDDRAAFPNSRRLQVASGELTKIDDAPDLTLGLADAGTPGTYGDETKTLQITVDAKGRVTMVAQFDLNTDNITEGMVNLFFTVARARASVSADDGIKYDEPSGEFTLDQAFTRGLFTGGTGIDYDNGTGTIALDTIPGVAGTYLAPTSITVNNKGQVTAIS